MESYLQRFLALGRPSSLSTERVELEPLVRDVLALVGPAAAHAKVALCFDAPAEPLAAQGDAGSLRQVLVNLILNAIEAANRPGGPPPAVVVRLHKGAEDRARLDVMDSGPGPAEALGDQLFEPFVTEKPDGTGLGLFVARQIAEAHGGTVSWRRNDNMTCFTLELPLPPRSNAHGSSLGG